MADASQIGEEETYAGGETIARRAAALERAFAVPDEPHGAAKHERVEKPERARPRTCGSGRSTSARPRSASATPFPVPPFPVPCLNWRMVWKRERILVPYQARTCHVPGTYLSRTRHVPVTYLSRTCHLAVPGTYLSRTCHVPVTEEKSCVPVTTSQPRLLQLAQGLEARAAALEKEEPDTGDEP
jgi:hypothetical protein